MLLQDTRAISSEDHKKRSQNAVEDTVASTSQSEALKQPGMITTAVAITTQIIEADAITTEMTTAGTTMTATPDAITITDDQITTTATGTKIIKEAAVIT